MIWVAGRRIVAVYMALAVGVHAGVLVGAFVLQHVVVHRFAKRVRAAGAALAEEAGASGGGGAGAGKSAEAPGAAGEAAV